ncbi:MAG: hypothetical protein WC967_00575 [Balneolaceae bacterium]
MFETLPLEIILLYSIFKLFIFYQQLHFKNFQGASKLFEGILGFSMGIGSIGGIVFLFYYGFNVVWWAPFALFAIGMIFQIVGNFIESLVGKFTLSIAGFIGWPICLYFLFYLTPIK